MTEDELLCLEDFPQELKAALNKAAEALAEKAAATADQMWRMNYATST